MPIARAEFGPSLPDLVGPRLRATKRRTRILVALVVLLAIALVAAFFLSRVVSETQATIRGPLTFNTRYDDRIVRQEAGPGELLRLATSPDRAPEDLVFRDGGPPPAQSERNGAPVAALALRMEPILAGIRRNTPSFQLRSEGRIKIQDLSGWLVRYQYRTPQGATTFGVRALLLPDVPKPTERVLDMALRSRSSPVVPNAQTAGSNGPMRLPFYGLAYGTEAP